MDRKSIICQYYGYVGELQAGKIVKESVAGALHLAVSDRKESVYLAGAREIMAEDIKPYQIDQDKYCPVRPAALPSKAVSEIAKALVNA